MYPDNELFHGRTCEINKLKLEYAVRATSGFDVDDVVVIMCCLSKSWFRNQILKYRAVVQNREVNSEMR